MEKSIPCKIYDGLQQMAKSIQLLVCEVQVSAVQVWIYEQFFTVWKLPGKLEAVINEKTKSLNIDWSISDSFLDV